MKPVLRAIRAMFYLILACYIVGQSIKYLVWTLEGGKIVFWIWLPYDFVVMFVVGAVLFYDVFRSLVPLS